MDGLILRATAWHYKRFPDAEAVHVAAKASVECGELLEAELARLGLVTKGPRSETIDEAADVFINLAILSGRYGRGNLRQAIEKKLDALEEGL